MVNVLGEIEESGEVSRKKVLKAKKRGEVDVALRLV